MSLTGTRPAEHTLRRRGGRRPAVLMLAALLAVPLVPIDLVGLAVTGPDGAQQRAEAAAASITVTLGSDDWTSSEPLILDPGGDVTWRNRSGRTLAITSPDGLLDSGPIPDGGSFVASLPENGSYPWDSDVGGAAIVVGGVLEGDPASPALDAIPNQIDLDLDPADIALHPELVLDLPRSVAIIGFTPAATVADANALLGSEWVVAAGIPEFGQLYVRAVEPQSDFTLLDDSLKRWRGSSAVEFATALIGTVDEAVPLPTPGVAADPGPSEWTWEPPAVAPLGDGGNWGQELVRAPAAWNLLEAAGLSGAARRSTTVIIDGGFQDHVDLDRLRYVELCDTLEPFSCTTMPESFHGNAVSGVLGADREDGAGVNGIDPLSRLVGVSYRDIGFVEGTVDYDGVDKALVLLLRNIRAGTLTDVNVVNLSVGVPFPNPALWWARWASRSCGPGASDDEGSSGTCFPNTADAVIEEYVELAKKDREVMEAFVQQLDDPPLFVDSAGNNGREYCRDKTVSCIADEFPDTEPQGNLASGYSWASDNWQLSEPDPIIAVESIGYSSATPVRDLYPYRPSLARSSYSDTSGHVSAPGWATTTGGLSRPAPDGYATVAGTSFSTPLVSGIAGLMASWDPSLSAAQIKQRILEWSIPDTTDGAAPRVDAFAPLLSLDGAARALVDVNDPSNDGNRRIAYNRDGTIALVDTNESSEIGFSTDPDGVVDMRDFRRFRDAWLLRCLIDTEPGCPDSIALDGQPDHPKRDLNLDGPVSLIAPAEGQPNPSEATFPRFDFNGDGEVSATAPASVPVDGGAVLTDVEVLASQWDDADPAGFGVDADDLGDLMVSGDLTLVADDLALTGDDAAGVTVVDVTTNETDRALSIPIPDIDELPLADHPVLTLPANQPYRLDVSVDGPNGSCDIGIGPIAVRPGEDRRIDLDAALALSVDPDTMRPGGSAEVTATAVTCAGSAEGSLVDLAIEPAGATGASLSDSQVVLDQDGTATTTLAAGDDTAVYTLTADTTLVNGPQLVPASATTRVTVAETYDLEVAAVDGDASAYDALDDFFAPGTPLGPSINGNGDVAFGALPFNLDRYGVFVSEPGDSPVDVADVDQVDGLPVDASDIFVRGEPQLTDSGEVVFTTQEDLDALSIATLVTKSTGPGADDTDDLALGLATLDSTTERFEQVGRPTINADGRVIFVATRQGGADVLAEKQGELVVEGPSSLLGIRPRLADDNTTVIKATLTRACADFPGVCDDDDLAIFDPVVVVGEGLQSAPTIVAEGRMDGWEAIGDADISNTGDIVAFVADRNGQRGLWIAVRRPDGSYQTPIAVAGPATDVDSDLIELDLDRPSLIQHAVAPAGPGGDRVLLAVRGVVSTPDGPSANGIHTVPLDLIPTGDPTIPYFPRVSPAQLVAQVGDTVDGRTITSLRLGDSLAAAAQPEFSDDHWVAFFARTDDERSMYVRARALPPPAVPAAFAGASPATLPPLQLTGGIVGGLVAGVASVADLLAGVVTHVVPAVTHAVASMVPPLLTQDDPPGPSPTEPADSPHVAALTIDDDTPVAGQPVRVVNRSRALDGTPSFAVVDETRNDPRVLAEPLFLAPDTAGEITYPSAATWTLEVGAPLITGPGATTAAFTVEAERGPNRDPVASVDGPYLLGPGQTLRMQVTSSDPDGDRLSVGWDFDDDGVTDSTRTSVALSGAQVQTDVCGGACVLDQPYPVTVTVSDGQGGSLTVNTTVTVSALDDLTLRLGPAITTIGQGSEGFTYAFVDAPDGSPEVPVELTAENVPDGWSVITPTGTVLTGSGYEVEVRVPAGTPDGSYSLDVVATSGTVTKRATLTVATTFALVPVCEATIAGVVTDESGTPVEDARLDISGLRTGTFDRTQPDGTYTATATLDRGYTTQSIRWDARADGFFPARGGAPVGAAPVYLTCDETTPLDIPLEAIPVADGIRARAVVGTANPVNPQRPVSTGIPLADAEVIISPGGSGVSPADGVVQLDAPVELRDSFGNPARVSVTARKSGFWQANRFLALDPAAEGSIADLGDLPLLEQCFGVAGGGRVVDQNGDPIEGARVVLQTASADDVLTDADGAFTFDVPQLLGEFNRATTVQFRAFTPPSFSPADNDAESTLISGCGERSEPVTIALNRPEPQPEDITLTVSGTVTDAETGEPVPSASVNVTGLIPGETVTSTRPRTDASGFYQGVLTFRGLLPPLAADVEVRVAKQGYFVQETTVGVVGDDPVVVDVALPPRQPVSLTGRVTDVDTGEPIEGIRLRTSNGFTNVATESGLDGAYAFDELFLLDQDGVDVARSASVEVTDPPEPGQDPEYYATDLRTTLFPDQPNVLDVELLRICEGFSVNGVVLDASTGEPIEGARVSARGSSATTDANGRYELTDIKVSPLNKPLTTTVRASAEGFFDGSVEITGFCGAAITADFGVPPGGVGVVTGTVTDAATGDPLPDVFVGSSWGRVTTTDDAGQYAFDDAPLQPDGSARDWVISAESNGDRQDKPVTVSADTPAVVDFAFTDEDTPPVADNQSVSTDAGVPVDVTLTGRDADGDDVTFEVTTEPTNGAVTGTPPNLTYTPRDGFTGTDTFEFTARANGLVSEPATVTVEVSAPATNPPTIDLPSTIEVLAGQSVDIPVAGNDSDGDALAFDLIEDAGGRASLANGDPGRATVTFVADESDAGSSFDVTVEVTAQDGSARGTVTMEVTEPVTNEPPEPDISFPTPITEGDTVTFDGSGSTDPEGGDLSYAWRLVDFDGNTVATDSGPTWEYTFPDDVVGGIQLTVTDPADNDAMLEEDVVVANAAPQPSAQTVPASSDGIQAGQQVTLQGTIADAGVDDTHTVSVDWGDGTSEQLAVTDRAFVGQRTYRQADEYDVTVTATDDDGDSGAVTLPLVITPPSDEPAENTAPSAADIAVETDAGRPVDLLLEGDDPDGDLVAFRVVTGPANGTVSGTAPNLRYTPDEGFDGVDTFTYVAFDGVLDSEPATVGVTVRAAPNRPPQITLPASVEIDAGQTRDVEVVVTDPDGDDVVVTVADDGGGRATLLQGIDLADAGDELSDLVQAVLADTLVLRLVTTVEDADSVFDVSIRASDDDASSLATVEVTVLAAAGGDGQPASPDTDGEPADGPFDRVVDPTQEPGVAKAPTPALSSPPALPATGAAAAPLLASALMMVAVGAALLRRSRR